MTTTKTKTGEVLTQLVWEKLADEYLKPRGWANAAEELRAERNACGLASYVDEAVRETSTGYLYHDVLWAETVNPEPYDGLQSLTAALVAVVNGELPSVLVSNQYCNHPVWTQGQNVKFRVWHDTHHVTGQYGFDPDGELRLFAAQARRLLVHPFGEELVDALFSESVYQLAACIALDGFPDEQFVRTPGPVGRQVLRLLLTIA